MSKEVDLGHWGRVGVFDVNEPPNLIGGDFPNPDRVSDVFRELFEDDPHPVEVVVSSTDHSFVVEEPFDRVGEEGIGLLRTVSDVELDLPPAS